MKWNRKTARIVIIAILSVALVAWVVLMITVFGRDKEPEKEKKNGLVRVWRVSEGQEYVDGVLTDSVRFEYDESGNLLRMINIEDDGTEEVQREYTYDDDGRINTRTEGRTKQELVYNDDGSVTLNVYEKAKNGEFELDTRYEVNDKGQVVAMTDMDWEESVEVTFDVNGRGILLRQSEDGVLTDTFRSEVDENGRATVGVSINKDGTVDRVRECEYTEGGTFVKIGDLDDPDSDYQTYRYDAQGRLIEVTTVSAGLNELHYTMTYDATGHLTSLRSDTTNKEVNAVTEKEWKYDSEGRLLYYGHTLVSGNFVQKPEKLEELVREYDDRGHVISEKYQKLTENPIYLDTHLYAVNTKRKNEIVKEYLYDENGCLISFRVTETRQDSDRDSVKTEVEQTDIRYVSFEVTQEQAEQIKRMDAYLDMNLVNISEEPYYVSEDCLFGDIQYFELGSREILSEAGIKHR